MDIIETHNELHRQCKNEITQKRITVGSNCQLKLADARLLARQNILIHLSPDSYSAMEQSYRYLKSCVNQRIPVYGVNTQFGDQVDFGDAYLNCSETDLYFESINARQKNIIKSLSCALGDVVAPEIIKIAMMLRVHCLAQGYSGTSLAAAKAILDYLNAGIVPIVHRYGSIGASGDLIPLATIAAGIIGEDIDVIYNNKVMKSSRAIEIAGLERFKPELRDGLAMINGTSFMTAIAALAVDDLNRLFKQMLSAIAMSLESMLVIDSAYHPLVHQLKRQSGEIAVNQFFIDFWQGSQLLTRFAVFKKADSAAFMKKTTRRLQDYYSLRAVAQGFGPFWENLERANIWIENEMNAVNDNPIVSAVDKEIYQGANFMGYYVTDACDILKMNIAQASTWLHALLANMLHPSKNGNLPANLAEDPHHNNGFRAFQLLAAALAVQNRKFAQSHQAFMLPTEGDNQDVNSLGTHAAFDLREAVENLEKLTAILLLVSAQALELRGIKKASPKAQSIYQIIRSGSPTLRECRVMQEEIITVINFLRNEVIYA